VAFADTPADLALCFLKRKIDATRHAAIVEKMGTKDDDWRWRGSWRCTIRLPYPAPSSPAWAAARCASGRQAASPPVPRRTQTPIRPLLRWTGGFVLVSARRRCECKGWRHARQRTSSCAPFPFLPADLIPPHSRTPRAEACPLHLRHAAAHQVHCCLGSGGWPPCLAPPS